MRKSIPEQSFFPDDSLSGGGWRAVRSSGGYVEIIQSSYGKPRQKAGSGKLCVLVQNIFFSSAAIAACAVLAVLLIGFVFSYQLSASQNSDYGETTELMEKPDMTAADSVTIQADNLIIDSVFADLGKGVSPFSREKNTEYIVRHGDTFFSIGMLYKIDTKSLKKYNRMTDADALIPGNKIIIPSGSVLRAFLEAEKKREEVCIARTAIVEAKPLVAGARSSSITPAAAQNNVETSATITLPEIDEFPLEKQQQQDEHERSLDGNPAGGDDETI
ncbi:MAG: LysM peptidoglycan-binding domain-containing protein [Spirochaetales bacterium]|nr:LysM peptidoglycan-binding domain-containing protein [Spirochaetales bacterium]